MQAKSFLLVIFWQFLNNGKGQYGDLISPPGPGPASSQLDVPGGDQEASLLGFLGPVDLKHVRSYKLRCTSDRLVRDQVEGKGREPDGQLAADQSRPRSSLEDQRLTHTSAIQKSFLASFPDNSDE